jgi:uncharacterized protein (DUF433 family)
MTDDNIIVVDEVLGGDPRIKGRRVGVYHVLQYVSKGFSVDEIAEDLGLTVKEVEAAIEYQKER